MLSVWTQLDAVQKTLITFIFFSCCFYFFLHSSSSSGTPSRPSASGVLFSCVTAPNTLLVLHHTLLLTLCLSVPSRLLIFLLLTSLLIIILLFCRLTIFFWLILQYNILLTFHYFLSIPIYITTLVSNPVSPSSFLRFHPPTFLHFSFTFDHHHFPYFIYLFPPLRIFPLTAPFLPFHPLTPPTHKSLRPR